MPHFLGRIPSRRDPRNLRLETYQREPLPPIPARCSWQDAVLYWSTAGNDQYGNCVIATAAHQLDTWKANTRPGETPVSNELVIELSRQMGALNGYMILDRLKWWRTKGMWLSKIWAFVEFIPSNVDQHRRAIADAGVSDIGLAMPRAWQNTSVWGTGSGQAYRPATWGYHSVPLVGYDSEHLYCVTWGRLQAITYPALQTYCDEAWYVIAPDWLRNDGESPSNLDLAALWADLKAVER